MGTVGCRLFGCKGCVFVLSKFPTLGVQRAEGGATAPYDTYLASQLLCCAPTFEIVTAVESTVSSRASC